MMAVEEEEVKEVLQKLQELVDQLYSFRECYLLKKEKKKKSWVTNVSGFLST